MTPEDKRSSDCEAYDIKLMLKIAFHSVVGIHFWLQMLVDLTVGKLNFSTEQDASVQFSIRIDPVTEF
jgi:hypothetical protein